MAYRDTHEAVQAEGYEGDALADLLAAYDEDVSLSDAAIAEARAANDTLSATITERDDEITRLKARNYDLLSQVPAQDTGTTTVEVESDISDDIGSVDELFTTLEYTDNND